MKIQLITLVSLISLLFCTPSFAALHIEPYAGAVFGGVTGSNGDDTYSGSLYGARIGYSRAGFLGAVEYDTGSYSVKDKATSDTYPAVPKNLGVTLAYTFKFNVRVYGTYQWDSQVYVKDTEATSKGTGSKFGLSFTKIRYVTLNLEATQNTFTKGEQGGVSADLLSDLNSSHYSFVVGFPFTLFSK